MLVEYLFYAVTLNESPPVVARLRSPKFLDEMLLQTLCEGFAPEYPEVRWTSWLLVDSSGSADLSNVDQQG